MATTLLINSGSASKKYVVFDGEEQLFAIHLERESGGLIATLTAGRATEKNQITAEQYTNSIRYFLDVIQAKQFDAARITAIGIRIVAPGTYFLQDSRIDERYVSELRRASEAAPLHIKPEILDIDEARRLFPMISMFGISDSKFHRTTGEFAKLYALPNEITDRFGLYRYGYHGISMQSIVLKIKDISGGMPHRVIACHLGSGASITAIKDGVSFDTSMGFSPLEGLPMGTRSGTIDPEVIFYLLNHAGMNTSDMELMLNAKSGFLGLSGGKSADVRELLEFEKRGEKGAKQALGFFVYQIKKYIGAYAAAMNGLDLLVFTAAIGERSSIMRSRICNDLENVGILIDESKNESMISHEGFIHAESKSLPILVAKTEEVLQMARDLKVLLT